MHEVIAAFFRIISVVLSGPLCRLHACVRAACLAGWLPASTGPCQCGPACVSSPQRHFTQNRRASRSSRRACFRAGPQQENYSPQERNRVLLLPLNRRRNAELRGDSGGRSSRTAELLPGVRSTLDSGRQRTDDGLIQRVMKYFALFRPLPRRSAAPPSVRQTRR